VVGAVALADEEPRVQADGRVLGVDPARGHLAVAHGPIPGLMPPMNMRFAVADPALLRGLRRGDQIRFVLELRNEEWTITAVELAGSPGPQR
jgi:Cu/Ag efflux protein CusF